MEEAKGKLEPNLPSSQTLLQHPNVRKLVGAILRWTPTQAHLWGTGPSSVVGQAQKPTEVPLSPLS